MLPHKPNTPPQHFSSEAKKTKGGGGGYILGAGVFPQFQIGAYRGTACGSVSKAVC
jgi:hypothetical protein